MKVAVATDKNHVSLHFGHCEGFEVYKIQDNKVIEKVFLPNPGHRPGFLPVYLSEQKVEVIIVGGIGSAAQDLFEENGIKVYMGVEGNCDDVVAKYLGGTLESSGTACKEHH